ncbi:MAG: CPBP family intramembrane metalloprotease [Actinobacteria bacterium]|nr:CPBP family intramembrane metalloprotease [Actinomycetota bacterium]
MLVKLFSQKNDNKSIVIIFSSIAILLFSVNFRLLNETVDAFILYLMLPLFVVQFLLKKEWRNFGFSLGEWKIGLLLSTVASLIAIIIIYFSVKYSNPVAEYYSGTDFKLELVLETIIYMFAWEFFFRGFLLFGLQEYVGFNKANIIQTLLFFIVHWNKPPVEFYSTLITGMIFGYIALRSKSFWPIVVIHTVIYISVIYIVNI